ncbi:MAG TPA: protein-disulfide reductase DsbD [Burkholderiaceae bacterium]|jgi:thiol:disulfide interchange protein DsbD|nr:protein-disulfide reductase DsbD [Burkholderiaceae bacterium]HRA78280.1 protein-disulfide reductase DsbD [Burkholderiaceae bacterium]
MICSNLNPLRWLALPLLLAATLGAARAADFLDPEQAFRVTLAAAGERSVELDVQAADGYYLYAEKFAVASDTPGVRLGALAQPAGKTRFDATFGKDVETHRGVVRLSVPIRSAPQAFELRLALQGCADAGLCYSPMSVDLPVTLASAVVDDRANLAPDAAKAPARAVAPAGAQADDAGNELAMIERTLSGGSLGAVAAVFLALGLLLSFTPCVLPMVPILSSIIVGQRQLTRGRGFALALAYSLGMALVYTAVGVAAGLAGEGLAAALQKPWVLATFATLLVALALSMFDVYQLEMPRSIQNRASQVSSRLPGGRFAGVFVMGAVSALVVGPCVAAPLAGALVYISRTKDVVVGGTALFAMAIGMSVPLLLIGLSAGSLLPRAGAWMIAVKRFFGVLLVGVAIWMVSPAIPDWAQMLAWAALLIVTAAFLRVFDPLPDGATATLRFGKGVGALMLIAGILQLVGVASGGRDVLQPLGALAARKAAAGTVATAASKPAFTKVHTLDELDRAIRSSARPTMVEFSADWCVSCKELERLTFSDPRVAERMSRLKLLKVDVTANSVADRELLRRFNLFGPPGILLFDVDGIESSASRVIGYQPADTFLERLDRLLGT